MLWMTKSIESHLSGQILSQIQSPRHQLELTCIRNEEEEEKNCGCEKDALKLKKMEKDYIHELDDLPDEEEDEESVVLKIDFGGTKSKMVGLSDQFEIVKQSLKKTHISLIGMAGIGKQVFEDPLILTHFECRAWVRVGRKSKFNGISLARAILAELDPTNCKFTEGDERISEYLEEILGDKKCLIVLDDVWDTRILDYLTSVLPLKILRNIRILLTSRDRIIAAYINRSMDSSIEVVRFLNEEESANLLCEKVFGKRDFPSQLEKAAKKIAKKCEGLPLMIVTVASYLSNAEKTPEYWTEVAEKKNSVFVDAYTDISKINLTAQEIAEG